MPTPGKQLNFPTTRRAFKVAFVLPLMVVFAVPQVLAVQPPESVNPNDEDPERREILQLIYQLEGGADKPVQAAEAFDVAWEMAVRREDPILNPSTGDSDVLRPGQHEVNAGARARLQRIYENGSAAFRTAYEDLASVRAKERLAESLETGSIRDLTQVILRYQFTAAGQQALENIIQLRLSRGEYLAAALQYGRLLRLRSDEDANNKARLTMLWWKAGLREEAADYLKNLVATNGGSEVQPEGQRLILPAADADLVEWMTQAFGSSTSQPAWNQSAGNYQRTGTQPVGPSQLQPIWSVSGFECAECVDCIEDDEINRLLQPLAGAIEDKFRQELVSNKTMAPVAQPVVVGNRVIFRGAAKLRCVDAETGELQWESTLIDRVLNSSLESWRRRGMENELVLQDVQGRLEGDLFEHWTLANVGGQLTANAELVFAVEESTSETSRSATQRGGDTAVNYLRAYDIATGRLKGQAGGSIGASGRSGRTNPLAGMYFLGAPLILDNQIYVMAENDQGIFLLQIRTIPMFDEEGQVDIRPIGAQLLSVPRLTLRQHPLRKLAGLTPSFGKGLLVCNTCDEQVIAVSADDQSVRWIYRYPGNVGVSEISREFVVGGAFSGGQSLISDQFNRWVDALPRIHAGRVYLTPRDCDRLICLDLESGKQIWSQPRGSMRQLVAVTDDTLVLTGQRHVECRAADTGKRIWKHEFESEKVCGRAISNGSVIQVPTSVSTLVTLDINTGRRLLSQPVSAGLLGNMVSINDRLYSQTMSGINAYQSPSAPDASPLIDANRLLLAGKVKEAEQQIALVKAEVAESSSARQEADSLMIALLLESLRVDFETNQDRIPELERLILGTAVSDDELADLMFSMLGMSIGDTAVLPEQWRQMNRNRSRLNQLQALVARRFVSNSNESAAKIAEQLISLLQNSDDGSEVRIGDVQISSWRNKLASVRKAMEMQLDSQRKEVQQLVGSYLKKRAQTAESKADALIFWQALLTCDLTSFAAELAVSSDVSLPDKLTTTVKVLSLLEAIDDGVSDGSALLKRWSTDTPFAFEDVVARTKLRATRLDDAVFGEGVVRPSAARDFVLPAAVNVENAEWSAAASERTNSGPYSAVPKVTESAARIGQSPAPLFMDSPVQNIPIRAGSAAFANWNLLQRPSASTVFAYDAYGRQRWTFEPGNGRELFPQGNRLQSYAVAYGQFLAVRINNMLFMLDCTNAAEDRAPELLWSMNINNEVGAPSDNQNRIPAYQSTTQYDMLFAGAVPVGEFSSLGIPVYSGRTLTMVNVLTGKREWTVEGLTDDCTMTSSGDEVMLISSASGSVECRSCLDGAVTSVTPLPLWWVDAKENSNASIHQLELNPGESERWMHAVHDGGALLLKRSTESSALEFYDLKRGENAWSIELPQDTVLSNVVDGHVAVLSDGNKLQIFDVVGGTRVCQHTVPNSEKSMYLYLRRSGGKWLVLANAFDPRMDDDVPPNETVPVNGHIYSVDVPTGDLSWSKEIQGEYLKVTSPAQAVMPSNVPLLLLMKRPQSAATPGRNGLRGPAYYQAKVFDVRSGEILYKSENLGLQLSYHCMNLNPQEQIVTIGFGIRDVVFDFSAAGEVAKPKQQ